MKRRIYQYVPMINRSGVIHKVMLGADKAMCGKVITKYWFKVGEENEATCKHCNYYP